MKKGIIKIQLHSALSAGSGYAYAGIIDSDICYDSYGFPYIPAKRIKGCLRDVAEKQLSAILKHPTENIFGVGGNNRNVGFSIGNAHIEGRDELAQQISSIKNKDGSGLSGFVDKQKILDQFTTIKAQTRMKNGVAEDNTLRYTRTVNETSPFSDKPMVFIAEVSYEDELEKDLKEDLENIAKGLRNIGLMRNRGLGSVECCFEPDAVNEGDKKHDELPACKICELSYVLTNVEPLMISASRDDVSLSYIPGQNVLGLMAARYLAQNGNSADDKAFYDLFLNGSTIFTNAYPYKNESVYYPAPAYVNKLKKTKKLVNIEAVAEMDQINGAYRRNSSEIDEALEKYVTLNGNLPKKMKGKYVSVSENKYDVHDVDMRVVYHHNQREKNDDGSIGKLYMHQIVTEDQMFAGRIILPSEHAELVSTLISKGDLFFGKSKTAQYGQCRLENYEISEYEPEKVSVNAGDEILVTLLSDGVFTNANGYTVEYDDVVKDISSKLGIELTEADSGAFSVIQTKQIFGYQTKWNLRRQPMPAVEAGSVYALKAVEKGEIDGEFIGERNLEGYGLVKVVPLKQIPYRLREHKSSTEKGSRGSISDDLKKLITNIVIEEMREKAELEAIHDTDFGKPLIGISSALRGRVTLMLSESIDNHSKPEQWKERQNDFINRVNSIKSKREKEIIVNILTKYLFDNSFSFVDINKLCMKLKIKKMKQTLIEDLSYSEEQVQNLVGPIWSDVLMTMLVNDKYMKGE